jgi:hypothetical protein
MGEQWKETPGHQTPEPNERREQMVTAIQISAVFSDAVALERAADNLLSRGIISGFSIEPARSGYLYEGKRTTEDQFVLSILVDSTIDEGKKRDIRRSIADSIGTQWDVPAIREESIQINEHFLTFIQRAGIEHKKFKRERRLRLSFMLAALLSISAALGTVSKKFVEDREHKAAAAEQVKNLKRIQALEEDVQEQIFVLEGQLQSGQSLHPEPTDMAASESFEETQKIIDTIRAAQEEIRLLMNQS